MKLGRRKPLRKPDDFGNAAGDPIAPRHGAAAQIQMEKGVGVRCGPASADRACRSAAVPDDSEIGMGTSEGTATRHTLLLGKKLMTITIPFRSFTSGEREGL